MNLLERFNKSDYDIYLLRVSIVVIFFLFGNYKWFNFEINGLKSIIEPTWLNILYQLFGFSGGSYFLGVIEVATAVFLVLAIFRPGIGILADVIVILTGLTTLSLLPQLGKIDSFIIKDVFLVGGGAVLLKYDLKRMSATNNKIRTMNN
ncbi:DUF417 family protein [Ochrobactrum sp. EDr1-4]|uniref:DUF417 family protein n=1 Tax=Ochrobactrum sp. EDr1-4 TaxID=3368622 RepID=UPI003B9F0464